MAMTTGPNPVPPTPASPPPAPPHTPVIARVNALEDAVTELIRRYNLFTDDVTKELGL